MQQGRGTFDTPNPLLPGVQHKPEVCSCFLNTCPEDHVLLLCCWSQCTRTHPGAACARGCPPALRRARLFRNGCSYYSLPDLPQGHPSLPFPQNLSMPSSSCSCEISWVPCTFACSPLKAKMHLFSSGTYGWNHLS